MSQRLSKIAIVNETQVVDGVEPLAEGGVHEEVGLLGACPREGGSGERKLVEVPGVADEDDGLPVRHALDDAADVARGDVIGARRLHDEPDLGCAAAHRGNVKRQRLLLQAELGRDLMDGAIEVVTADGVRLEVVGLAADDLGEAFVLRANLDAGLVEIDRLDARGPRGFA